MIVIEAIWLKRFNGSLSYRVSTRSSSPFPWMTKLKLSGGVVDPKSMSHGSLANSAEVDMPLRLLPV